jgi:hypothetical protein
MAKRKYFTDEERRLAKNEQDRKNSTKRRRKKGIYLKKKLTLEERRRRYLLRKKKNRECHKQEISLYMKEYRKRKKKERALYERIMMKTNINFKLSKLLRNRLYKSIKNNQKVGSAVSDLGCSIPELKIYLESKFQPGMTWDNWSITGWHIDHIIPLDSFNLSNREEFLKACHYTNLQPLWAINNWEKSKS